MYVKFIEAYLGISCSHPSYPVSISIVEEL